MLGLTRTPTWACCSRWSGAVGPQGHVAVLSTNISSSFPLILEGESRWALRHPNLWPLVAFYPDEIRAATMVSPKPFAVRSPFEQQFTRDVVDNLLRTKPELLLVLRPDAAALGGGGSGRFEYLAYFSGSPGSRTRSLRTTGRENGSGGLRRLLATGLSHRDASRAWGAQPDPHPHCSRSPPGRGSCRWSPFGVGFLGSLDRVAARKTSRHGVAFLVDRRLMTMARSTAVKNVPAKASRVGQGIRRSTVSTWYPAGRLTANSP